MSTEIANLNQVTTPKAVTTNIIKFSSGDKINMTAQLNKMNSGIN